MTGKPARPNRMEIFQAISGVMLLLFLWVHLLFVGSVIVNPAWLDWIGWFLEVIFVAQVGGPIVLLLMIYHFVIAARKMPFRAGELSTFWANAKQLRHKDTWLWLIQVATALIILVMASIHIFTMLTNLPINAARSAARVQGGWLPFYLILLPIAELHVGIGFYRLGVKYGYITRKSRAFWQRGEYALIGFFLVVGVWALYTLYTLKA
jgi:fumarate reductase subunit C